MRLQTTLTSKVTSLALSAVMAAGLATQLFASAPTQPGKIEVKAIRGQVTSFIPGGTPAPLKAGTMLSPGSTIKTGKDSAADLFLGKNVGSIRIEENSTLSIDKLTVTDTGADSVVDTQLNLSEGTILANVNKLSAASKYEIKVPNGVAGIRGTRLLASANSYFVLLDGAMVYVHVPPGGNPTPYTLQAPPPVYFSPLEGVKHAPMDLVENVEKRFKEGPGGTVQATGRTTAATLPETYVSPGTGK